jgi:pimeloyl-ACP methyl ester carboxylesterase
MLVALLRRAARACVGAHAGDARPAGTGESDRPADPSAYGLEHYVADIEAPTLVIAGEHDAFGGPTADEIAEALPDPTVVTLPATDHFAFLEPAGRAPWSRAVLDFLAA